MYCEQCLMRSFPATGYGRPRMSMRQEFCGQNTTPYGTRVVYSDAASRKRMMPFDLAVLHSFTVFSTAQVKGVWGCSPGFR